jgi:nicotinamide-nucleotide amidase
MPESNRRQALFPRGSRVIPNPDGTAPGIDFTVDRGGRVSHIFALPGVPSEMKRMWLETVADAVVAMRPEHGVFLHRRVKCFGAGESAIEAMLPDLIRRGRDPLVGITAHEATITLRITARGGSVEECRGKIAPTEATILDCLGSLVYGFEDDELEDALVRRLVHAGQTVATAEIATEGLVASLLAQAVGRLGAGQLSDHLGAVFRGGAVLPATAADAEGVVRLAEEARGRFGGSLGLAVGRPQPHAEGRQAVVIAAVGPFGHREMLHVLGGAAGLARSRAAKTAVDLLRSVLPDAGGEGR